MVLMTNSIFFLQIRVIYYKKADRVGLIDQTRSPFSKRTQKYILEKLLNSRIDPIAFFQAIGFVGMLLLAVVVEVQID